MPRLFLIAIYPRPTRHARGYTPRRIRAESVASSTHRVAAERPPSPLGRDSRAAPCGDLAPPVTDGASVSALRRRCRYVRRSVPDVRCRGLVVSTDFQTLVRVMQIGTLPFLWLAFSAAGSASPQNRCCAEKGSEILATIYSSRTQPRGIAASAYAKNVPPARFLNAAEKKEF